MGRCWAVAAGLCSHAAHPPPARLLLAGRSSEQNKEALACTRVVRGCATRSQAIEVTGKPISPSLPGWLPRAIRQQQAGAGSSFKGVPKSGHWHPARSALSPLHPLRWAPWLSG